MKTNRASPPRNYDYHRVLHNRRFSRTRITPILDDQAAEICAFHGEQDEISAGQVERAPTSADVDELSDICSSPGAIEKRSARSCRATMKKIATKMRPR